MDTSKNMFDIKDPNELKETIVNLLKEVSKLHPDYPVYGYDYVDGKLVSVARDLHKYL